MRLGALSWLFGITVVAFYTWAGLAGWHLTSEPAQFVPASVRSSPGGYRSFHFWHAGWRGGK